MKRFNLTLASLMVCAAVVACSFGTPTPAVTTAVAGPTLGPGGANPTSAAALPSATTAAGTPTAPPPTATPAAQVLSNDGQAELILPPGALPAGVSLADIHINAVDPNTSRVTSDGQPALATYAFEPNGLVFATPAQLVLTLPLPANRRLPLMLSLSTGGAEWLAGVEYTLDAEAGKLVVSVPVKHFSNISSVLGFFTASIADPPNQQVGKSFDVPVGVVRVRTTITTTTDTGDVITTTSTAPWKLSGKLTATRTLGPRTVANAPAATTFQGHAYNLVTTYTCNSVGAAGITYEATLNAETTSAGFDVAADYPLKVSTRPFKCLAAGTTDMAAGAAQPPVLTRFTADFQQPVFSTFYEITATDPQNQGLKYFWSNSETCGEFIWDSSGGSPKAKWSHPHPPCPKIKGDHPGQITVRVVNGAGLESVYTYFDGSATGDKDLTKLTPGSQPTATPVPK